ncbi:MAG: substrate-binding domain-containing protein, partial [Pseudomonadota bacterium]
SITTAMFGRKPSGIIMPFHPSSHKLKKLLKMSNIPVVEVWGGGEGKPVDMSVSISSLKSGQLVADHFHELGKTHPAFFGEDYERDIERWNGFSERWVHLTGGAPPFMLDADVKDRQAGESYRWGNDIIAALKENYPEADCLFCTSDITAAGALSAAQRQGLHVPDELAICGSGDLDIAASTYPSLTTVDLSSRKMGTIAANLIIDCLAQKPIDPKNVIIHPSLKIRESTVRSL